MRINAQRMLRYNGHMHSLAKRFLWLSVVSAVSFALAAPARAADAFLCNDGFTAGNAAGFQTGFGPGEEAAIKIDPPLSAFPLTIQSALLFYGQNDDQSAITESIKVYAADGQDGTGVDGFPGTLLGTTAAPMLDSTSQLNQVAFDTPLLVTAGPFWVALHMERAVDPTTQTAPGPATDNGATRAGADAMFVAGVWSESSTFGVNGNWVIRVEVNAAAAQSDGACRIDGGVGEGEGGAGEGEGGAGEGEGEGAGGLSITSVNPSSTAAGTEARVTLTGAGFADGVAVRVGSATCADVQVQNAGALLCTVPSTLAAGTYDVIAQQGAATFVFPSGFTVTPAVGGCGCAAASADGTAAFALVVAVAIARARRRR